MSVNQSEWESSEHLWKGNHSSGDAYIYGEAKMARAEKNIARLSQQTVRLRQAALAKQTK